MRSTLQLLSTQVLQQVTIFRFTDAYLRHSDILQALLSPGCLHAGKAVDSAAAVGILPSRAFDRTTRATAGIAGKRAGTAWREEFTEAASLASVQSCTADAAQPQHPISCRARAVQTLLTPN